MSQRTHGILYPLSRPEIYRGLQRLMGANAIRSAFAKEFIRPFAGCRILDIGCGPADILEFLSDVDYVGFDISEAYIADASNKYGGRAQFFCRELSEADIYTMPRFDVVIALGLLHHLDDDLAIKVLRLAHMALKPAGRLVSFDPCFHEKQSSIARLLINADRGGNVRNQDGYALIAEKVFDSARIVVRHRAWIPYTHCFMECIRK